MGSPSLWSLLYFFLVKVCCSSSVPESEVLALRSLYLSTNGNSWNYTVSQKTIEDGGQPWNFSLPINATDPCVNKWFGVKCTATAENCVNQPCSITHLTLGSYNMQGTLPASLTDLTSLGRISLHSNQISGPLPTFFSEMTKIYYLLLTSNYLTGTIPESYSKLLLLQRFDAVDNYLTGTIPAALGSSTALSIFHMNGNLISGTFPSSIAANSRLRHVEFMNNMIGSSLPNQFGDKYSSFYISQNLLTGTLPTALLQHTVLDLLYVGDNFITGRINGPTQQLRLEKLSLDNNFLTGSIPASISLYTELSGLHLSHNLFSDTLPANMTLGNHNLFIMDLSYNRLSGTLPEGLLAAPSSTYLYLHHNRFTGTLPEHLLSTTKRFQQLTLYNNKLSGTIPASFGLCSTLTTLLLQNNKLRGNIGEIFRKANALSLTPFPSLQLLDISSNRFSGKLPVEIFQLPSIRHVAIIENCFSGSIPSEICGAISLEGLLLEGLRTGTKCRDAVWDPAGLSNTYFTSGIEGSIPQCVFSMPNIKTLHLAGNRLTGTLPPSLNMTKLVDLKLSDNRLSGRIPQFLQEHIVASIDLSRNKFMGVFDLPKMGGRTTSLKLSVNRLSGQLARGFDTIDDVDVLKGNLFQCTSRHDIPSHDPDSASYVCGSDQFDAPLELWLILGGLVVVLTGIVVAMMHTYRSNRIPIDCCWRMTDEIVRLRSYCSIWLAALSKSNLSDHVELSKLISTLKQLRLVAILTAAFILCFFGVIYISFKQWGGCGSHVHQYRWIFTAAYMSGVLPAFLMLAVLACLLYFILRLIFDHNKNLTDMQHPRKVQASQSLESKDNPLINIQSYVYIVSVSLANVFVVLFVKGIYVYLLIWQNISYDGQVGINVAMSLFDVIWNTIVVTKAVSLFSPLVRNKVRIRWHLLLLLFNSIVAPMIAAACTDRNCFVEIFVGRDSITSKSQYVACSDATGYSCSSLHVIDLATSFTPPYSYSYQCMSSILTNFIPVFLFSHILLGFLLPCLVVACLWFLSSRRSNPLVQQFIPHIFFTGMYRPQYDKVNKLIRPGIIISSILHHFAVMLTFGVSSPILALCIAWTICVTTLIWQLAFGRFVDYYSSSATTAATDCTPQPTMLPRDSSILMHLNDLCADIWQGPLKAIWVVVDYSLVFFICLTVDIVGDIRGWLFGVLCMGIPAVSVMVLLRCMFRSDMFTKPIIKLFRCANVSQQKNYGVSMISVAKSPIANASCDYVTDNENNM